MTHPPIGAKGFTAAQYSTSRGQPLRWASNLLKLSETTIDRLPYFIAWAQDRTSVPPLKHWLRQVPAELYEFAGALPDQKRVPRVIQTNTEPGPATVEQLLLLQKALPKAFALGWPNRPDIARDLSLALDSDWIDRPQPAPSTHYHLVDPRDGMVVGRIDRRVPGAKQAHTVAQAALDYNAPSLDDVVI